MYYRTDEVAVSFAEADKLVDSLIHEQWAIYADLGEGYPVSTRRADHLEAVVERAITRRERRRHKMIEWDRSQLQGALAFEHNHERN